LDGHPQPVFPRYETIFYRSGSAEIRPREAPLGDQTLKTLTGIPLRLPDPAKLSAEEAIRQVGFTEEHSVLPYTDRSFKGYRLLSEYFAFPYKFLFFDIYGIDKAVAAKFGGYFDILIHLKDVTPPIAPVVSETFRLGCTPVINLFQRLADPLYVSQHTYEYHIIPDIHRQATTEIYSIDNVYTSDPRSGTVREFSPFYSLRHSYGEQAERSFWYANRRGSQRPDDEGTEIFMSL